MNCDPENLQNEILELLSKIDELNENNSYLKDELNQEKEKNINLEKELNIFKQKQMKASKQRTRILRERDEIVRDISCELDTVSAKLNSEIKEKGLFEMKMKDRVAEIEVLEAQNRQIKSELKKKDKEILKLKDEITQFQEMKEIFEQMKLEIKADSWKKKLNTKKINEKMKKIHEDYLQLKNDLNKSKDELKTKFKESVLMNSSNDKKNFKNCNCQKDIIDIEKPRMKLLKTENIYLKKKVIKLLNQYCSSLNSPIPRKSKSIYKKLQNKFELSFNQKIKIPSISNLDSQKNVKENPENKISSIINASFVEQSNIIGGKTFHFIAKKTNSFEEIEENQRQIFDKFKSNF